MGCRSVMRTAAYLIQGTTVEPKFKGLAGKKVAVVCRPVANLTFGNPTAATELARQLSQSLKTHVPRIKLIDPQKVAEWTDEHEWTEFSEVGKALGAQMVVGIDLADFRLYQGQTLYQGRASLQVAVYDCSEGGKQVFEQQMPQILYPRNSGIPTTDKPESQFRAEFIGVIAELIGRNFYSHDRMSNLLLEPSLLD
jgi:hypothetical protein